MPGEAARPSPAHHDFRRDALAGARDSIALAVSSLPWGLVFGLIAQPLFGMAKTILMSAWIFSGTAQFVAIDQWRAGTPLLPMLLAVFAVNARYLLQGMTLQPYLAGQGSVTRVGTLFFLTDMSWALSLPRLRNGQVGPGYLLGAAVTVYSGWVIGTVIGCFIPLPLEQSKVFGLDFAVSAALVGMAGAQFAGRTSLLPWAVTIVVMLVTTAVLPISLAMILGGLAGALVGAWRHEP